MNLKEAELALATHRLLDAGRMAQELFQPLPVRLHADDETQFRVTITVDGCFLAAMAGEHVVEVADGVAAFIIHLTTRSIDE
jgi:hypothetical protein